MLAEGAEESAEGDAEAVSRKSAEEHLQVRRHPGTTQEQQEQGPSLHGTHASTRPADSTARTNESAVRQPYSPVVSMFDNQYQTGSSPGHSQVRLLSSFSPPPQALPASSISSNPLHPTISAQSAQSVSIDTHPGYSTTSHAHSHLLTSMEPNPSRPCLPQSITLPRRSASDPIMSRSNRLSSFSKGAPYSSSLPLVLQPALDLNPLRYNSLFARFHHLIYPLLCFGHIPVTLFLDYNVMYALAQVAAHPYAQDVATSPAQYIAGQPRANLWWTGLGFYALSTLGWLLGIVLIHDVYYRYIRMRNAGHPPIMSVYLSAPAFDMLCMRSYAIHCFLWRLRLSAFTGIRTFLGSRRQGMLELAHHYMQNWPTMITLLPRAALSLVLLLSFTSTDTTVLDATYVRDGAYFRSDGTLSPYSVAVNLLNLSWAAYRMLLVIGSSLLFLVLSHHSMKSSGMNRDSYMSTSYGWTARQTREPQWKQNLRSRVTEAVTYCSSRSSDNGTGPELSSRKPRQQKRSSGKNGHASPFRAQQDMHERQRSEAGHTFYIPVRPTSALNTDVFEDNQGSIRFSSIPIRHKRTSSSASTTPSVMEYLRQQPARQDASAESLHIEYERPYSSLDRHLPVERHIRISSGVPQLPEIPDEVDEEDLERLEWEAHPPLTPRGSLIQAREELAHETQQRSYWNGDPSASNAPISSCVNNASIGPERTLGAIVEESEEEASLRRANSNKRTVSSRQSSLRRTDTDIGYSA